MLLPYHLNTDGKLMDSEECGLNGNVYGGATGFALACDFRIGVEGCRLQMSPARLGIQYYHSGLRRYVERLGLPEAKRLFLMVEQIDTATMLRIGFLTEACAPERFEARLEVVAGMLAQRSPASLRGLKASLNSICPGTAIRQRSTRDSLKVSLAPMLRKG
ncbi:MULTISPECIES: enoyl-CoA hydratase-related protein [unclassified Bradyrhizobium]|uniref:enoyl-CoA hydratase/isomerase family protein n=1 Tax=unclassified Bradyrhizobium TaxID=2631580 RepID=UPI0033966933